MAKRYLAPPEELRKFLDYNPESGYLRWREQKCDHCNGWSMWNRRYAGKLAFTRKQNGYNIGTHDGHVYASHRVIWAMVTGSWPELHIDHINGIRDDNRWENLREVTHGENQLNKRLYKNNTSGHAGVVKCGDRWTAQIKANGKEKWLGIFDTFDDAVRARKEAQRALGFSDRHGKPCF